MWLWAGVTQDPLGEELLGVGSSGRLALSTASIHTPPDGACPALLNTAFKNLLNHSVPADQAVVDTSCLGVQLSDPSPPPTFGFPIPL